MTIWWAKYGQGDINTKVLIVVIETVIKNNDCLHVYN